MSVSTPWGDPPRRFISSRVAAWSKSNSASFKCLMALGRSLGKICRCGGVSVAALERATLKRSWLGTGQAQFAR
jgi:hypothetical protein